MNVPHRHGLRAFTVGEFVGQPWPAPLKSPFYRHRPPEQAYRELVPQIREGHRPHRENHLLTGTLDAKKRIAAGESFDLLIMSSPDIDAFT